MRRSPLGDGVGPPFGGDSPGGGIGRRAWLRAMCPQGRAGSTPVPGSMLADQEAGQFGAFLRLNLLEPILGRHSRVSGSPEKCDG